MQEPIAFLFNIINYQSILRKFPPQITIFCGIIQKLVMKKIRSYLRGVGSELKKVTFPSRDDVIQMTTLVVSLSLLLAVMVGLLDFAFRYAVRWLVA